MPLADIVWVLEVAHRFCAEHGFGFASYPMHEVAAHPRAADVLRLFAEHVGAAEFEPFSTTGVPLAVREDWRELLEVVAALGSSTVWLAFHGLDEEHDQLVNRPGAFAETCLAVERAHAAGLRVGCNVFLTRHMLPRVDALADTLERLVIDEMAWAPASFYPTARGRRYAAELPGLDDLLPHASRIAAVSRLGRAWWHNLEAYTEARYVQRALTGEWPDRSREGAAAIGLVCRPNLDVHTGKAGLYGVRHGNLRADGPAVVLERAVAHGPVSDDTLYLPGLEVPPVEDLARGYGDPDGREIHFWHGSVRYRWLDRLLTQPETYGHPASSPPVHSR